MQRRQLYKGTLSALLAEDICEHGLMMVELVNSRDESRHETPARKQLVCPKYGKIVSESCTKT